MDLNKWSIKITKVNNGFVVHEDLVDRAGYKINVFESTETLVTFLQQELQNKKESK